MHCMHRWKNWKNNQSSGMSEGQWFGGVCASRWNSTESWWNSHKSILNSFNVRNCKHNWLLHATRVHQQRRRQQQRLAYACSDRRKLTTSKNEINRIESENRIRIRLSIRQNKLLANVFIKLPFPWFRISKVHQTLGGGYLPLIE